MKRNFNYFHPTSGCTAQSGRGALETWSESSTLLVVFCSTAESRGPWSSLANCRVPPRVRCAIKDNCANDVQPCCSSAPLWDQVNPCSRQKETQSPVMPHFHSKEQDVLVIKCLCEIHLQKWKLCCFFHLHAAGFELMFVAIMGQLEIRSWS